MSGMIKLLLQFIGAVVLGVVLIAILILGLNVLHWFIGLVVGLLFLAGFIYLINLLFKIGTQQTQSKADTSFKISALKQHSVALFAAEPLVSQLVNVESAKHITEWALNGSIV